MTIKGAHHYLHMAERNYEMYLDDEEVKLKKYFYVLRPILALRYVLHTRMNPPMLFEELVKAELKDEAVKEDVNRLLYAKRNSPELGKARKISILNDYIQKELVLLKNEVNSLSKEQTSWDELNEFFIKTIWDKQSQKTEKS